MEGEVSSPHDEDGRSLGPDSACMGKALPPAWWHQARIFTLHNLNLFNVF